MSVIPEISAQILVGIGPLRDELQNDISRLIIYSSEALVALQTILQSELFWDYLLLMAAVWILSSAAIICFWFGWVLGTNIYGLGMWLTGRSMITPKRVRMVAKHTSGKNKLGGKASSLREISRPARIQGFKDFDHSLLADNTSGSGSQPKAISESSRSFAGVSHPVYGCEIGNPTPDKAAHIHELLNLNETAATDNPSQPLAVLTSPETTLSIETATVFSDTNTTPHAKAKKKSASSIICAEMDGLAESPINTAKGLVGLLTPPSTPVRSLVMELQAAGAVTPPHGVKIADGGEESSEKDPSSPSVLTTPTQASVRAKRGRKRAPYKMQDLRRHVMEDTSVETGNKKSAP